MYARLQLRGGSEISDRVVIADSNWRNPYARELARVLTESGREVLFVSPFEPNWNPPCETRSSAVAKRSIGAKQLSAGKLVSHCEMVSIALREARRRSACLIVPWLQDPVWALALLVYRGPTVIVHHNPQPHRDRGRLPIFATGLALARHQAVVHSNHLLMYQPTGHDWLVAPHPSYSGTLLKASCKLSGEEKSETCRKKFRLLFAGGARADKGSHTLVDIVSGLDSHFLLVLTDPKAASPKLQVMCKRMDVGLELLTQPVTDDEFVRAYINADAVIAPYVNASDSGTVAMAMTVGTPVVAFASEGLASTIRSTAFVSHDAFAMANRVKEWRVGGVPSCFVQTPHMRDKEVAARWGDILQNALS